MLSWPFQAIKRAKLHITGTTSCVKFVFLLEKAKWFAHSSVCGRTRRGGPQQAPSCVESGERRASSKLHYGLSH